MQRRVFLTVASALAVSTLACCPHMPSCEGKDYRKLDKPAPTDAPAGGGD